MQHSVKSERLLKQLGVLEAIDGGHRFVVVGPTYELRDDPGIRARMAFLRDDEGRLCVGYATRDAEEWEVAAHEPYSLRAFGYYERRLKRIGDFVQNTPAEACR
jgi:hypothetical protein